MVFWMANHQIMLTVVLVLALTLVKQERNTLSILLHFLFGLMV